MNHAMSTVPFGERFSASCEWAQSRAAKSVSPERYMELFHNAMAEARRNGENAIVDQSPDWGDPTHLAAEVEALAARRAMRHWGTTWGICLRRRVSKQDLAA